MLIKGLHHVSMKCRKGDEYNKVISFYTSILNLKVTPHKARLTALHKISLHFFAVLHKSPLTGGSLPAEFLYKLTKNLTALLSRKPCAV